MKGRKKLRRAGIVLGFGALLCAGMLASGALGMVSGITGSTDSSSTSTDTTALTDSSSTATDTTATDTSTTDTTTTETTTSSATTTAPTTTTEPSSSSPSISSDKNDYAPGSTVTLSGNGWRSGEVVHISVNDDVGQSWSYGTDVTADPNGSFSAQFQLSNSFIASYTATATGPLSGTTTTTFTDGQVKTYVDSARTIDRSVFERGGGAADGTMYARAAALAATSSYKIEVFDKSGASKAISGCIAGTTDPQDFSYTIQPGDPLSDSSSWKVVAHEYKKSGSTSNLTCSTSAPFASTPDDGLFTNFNVAQAYAFTTSAAAGSCTSEASCTGAATTFGSGATAFIRVIGYSQQSNKTGTTWIRSGGTACANTTGNDRATPNSGGTFPGDAAGSFLQYPPTTGDSWNTVVNYDSGGPCQPLTSNAGSWELKLDQANAAQTVQLNAFTLDLSRPSVTIDQASGQADPASTAPINFTATFSEPVTGFNGSDVSITGTAGGTKTVVVTGGPTTYNVAVSGMTTAGTVIATIAANGAQDNVGNLNTASTSTDNSVTWSPTATLIVIKHVINDNGGTATAANFTLDSGGTNDSPDDFAGAESPGTTVTLDPGSYGVTETGPTGYSASFSADCSGSIAAGQTKTCTVTNNDQAATLIVIKHVINDNGGTATAASFTLDSGGTNDSPDNFAGAEAPGTTVTLDAGSYGVTETGPSGYTASFSADCSGSIAA
jgi:cytoskeletal protein RodZ